MSHAFLIDYEFCTGCHSCEVACQMVNDLPLGQFGIKLNDIGPWPYGEKQWQYDYAPFVTDQCTHCVERTEQGMQPFCVQHCQAKCLQFGDLDDLIEGLKRKPKQLLQVVS